MDPLTISIGSKEDPRSKIGVTIIIARAEFDPDHEAVLEKAIHDCLAVHYFGLLRPFIRDRMADPASGYRKGRSWIPIQCESDRCVHDLEWLCRGGFNFRGKAPDNEVHDLVTHLVNDLAQTMSCVVSTEDGAQREADIFADRAHRLFGDYAPLVALAVPMQTLAIARAG